MNAAKLRHRVLVRQTRCACAACSVWDLKAVFEWDLRLVCPTVRTVCTTLRTKEIVRKGKKEKMGPEKQGSRTKFTFATRLYKWTTVFLMKLKAVARFFTLSSLSRSTSTPAMTTPKFTVTYVSCFTIAFWQRENSETCLSRFAISHWLFQGSEWLTLSSIPFLSSVLFLCFVSFCPLHSGFVLTRLVPSS